MNENIMIGGATMVACLTIQCFMGGLMLRILIVLERKKLIRTSIVAISFLLVATMLIMLVGNLIQVTIWAGLFVFCGEFEQFATSFYHSVVNFTTLGYGDLVMSEERRLLGALEAANGVLMFGLVTGFMFAVLSELLNREWVRHVGQETNSKDTVREESGRRTE
jgi:hypothetical protein